jgi:hypothetical protein
MMLIYAGKLGVDKGKEHLDIIQQEVGYLRSKRD